MWQSDGDAGKSGPLRGHSVIHHIPFDGSRVGVALLWVNVMMAGRVLSASISSLKDLAPVMVWFMNLAAPNGSEYPKEMKAVFP